MRGQSRANSITGVALGLALLAPLMTRPDALLVLEEYGWDLSPSFADRYLPLQLASASAVILAVTLHQTWRNGLLACSGVVLAWSVDDLLLAFALYFALGHSREAFFEEFKERQSLTPAFSKLYLRSLPLTPGLCHHGGRRFLDSQHGHPQRACWPELSTGRNIAAHRGTRRMGDRPHAVNGGISVGRQVLNRTCPWPSTTSPIGRL